LCPENKYVYLDKKYFLIVISHPVFHPNNSKKPFRLISLKSKACSVVRWLLLIRMKMPIYYFEKVGV
jgi:hypothetical protein